jgi:hypothetical protein
MRWRCASGNNPDDDRRAGLAAAAGSAGGALLAIHYPLGGAMRNMTTLFIAALMLPALPAAAQKPGQTARILYRFS